MHQISQDPDVELFGLITEQQREVKRLTARAEEAAAQARECKRDLKEAEQRLHSLLEETIADRPLFQARPESIPVAAAKPVETPPTPEPAHVESSPSDLDDGVYSPSHPWYYKAGGRPLEFDEIEASIFLESEIESTYKLPKKDQAKRSAKLTATLKKLESDLVKAGADYATAVAAEPEDEDEGKGFTASNRHMSLSLAHNHVVYYKGQVAAVRRMLGLPTEPEPAVESAPIIDDVEELLEQESDEDGAENLLREETWSVYEDGKRLGDVLGIDETQANARACQRWPKLNLRKVRFELIVSTPEPQPSAEPKGDLLFEDWRAVAVDDLELPSGLIDSLKRHDYFTAGELDEWRKTIEGKPDHRSREGWVETCGPGVFTQIWFALDKIRETPGSTDQSDESWHGLPVAKLHLPVAILDDLAQNQLIALGDVAQVLQEDGFRDLNVGFHEGAKVRAAMDLWWLESRSGVAPWFASGEDDSPADRDLIAMVTDWLKRERTGDTEPCWDRWSEFEVSLEDGATLRVEYEPRASARDVGHFDFHGPLTETGYRSYFTREDDHATPIVKRAEEIAREVAAESTKKQAKSEKRKKRESKAEAKKASKPAPEADPAQVEPAKAVEPAAAEEPRTHWLDIPVSALEAHGLTKPVIKGMQKVCVKNVGDLKKAMEHGEQAWGMTGVPVTFAQLESALDSLCRARTQGRDLYFPDAIPSEPETHMYRVLIGNTDDDMWRHVCWVMAGDLLTAAEDARARIDWQIYNLTHAASMLLISEDADGKGLLIAENREWLPTPVSFERKGLLVASGSDLVPAKCPAGKPRVYRIDYHDTEGDRVLTFYSAISPRAAAALAQRDYPKLQSWRIEAKPSDEEREAKTRKKKADTRRAVARSFAADDRAAQMRVETSRPDGGPA